MLRVFSFSVPEGYKGVGFLAFFIYDLDVVVFYKICKSFKGVSFWFFISCVS